MDVSQGRSIIEEERQHELALDTHPLNIMFYLKKGEDEEILDAFLLCVKYILKKQDKTNQRFVSVIYLEQWTLDAIPKEFKFQKRTAFEVYPLEEPNLSVSRSIEKEKDLKFT